MDLSKTKFDPALSYYIQFLDWCAKLYEENNYNGWKQVIYHTNYFKPFLNAMIIKVNDGCILKAFRTKSLKNVWKTFTSGVTTLKDLEIKMIRHFSFSCSCIGKFIT